MWKCKLRNCANCRGRHELPTGKNCDPAVQLERKERGDMSADLEIGAATIFNKSDEEIAEALQLGRSVDEHETDDNLADFMLSTDETPLSQGEEAKFRECDRPSSQAGSEVKGALFLCQQLKVMQQECINFERRLDCMMVHMEYILGKVAGVQQAQLERSSKLSPRAWWAKPPSLMSQAEPIKATRTRVFNLGDYLDTTVPESYGITIAAIWRYHAPLQNETTLTDWHFKENSHK